MKIVPYRKTNELETGEQYVRLFDEFFNRFYEEEGEEDNFRLWQLILWSMIRTF